MRQVFATEFTPAEFELLGFTSTGEVHERADGSVIQSEYGLQFVQATINMGSKKADPLEDIWFVDESRNGDVIQNTKTFYNNKNNVVTAQSAQAQSPAPSPYNEKKMYVYLNPPLDFTYSKSTGQMVAKTNTGGVDLPGLIVKMRTILKNIEPVFAEETNGDGEEYLDIGRSRRLTP